jgi:hypothetical protein
LTYDGLSQEEKRAKVEIEAEVVKEHWGQEPERPLSWTQRKPDDR